METDQPFNLTSEQALRLEMLRLVMSYVEYIQEEGEPDVMEQIFEDTRRALAFVHMGTAPAKGQSPC